MFIYGLDATGEFVHIADSPKGNAGGLTCIYCAGKLTAKKGDIVAHHFAHQRDQGQTCTGSSTTFQKIVFGFEYYDFALSNSEKKALHTLTNACLARPEGYLYEDFYWRDRHSAKYLLYDRGISSNRSSDRIVEALVEEGFFSRQNEPNPNYDSGTGKYLSTTGVYGATLKTLRPTSKALAFCLKLPLFRFIRVLQDWWTELEGALTAPQEKELVIRHRARMALNKLYFLSIKAGWQTDPTKPYSRTIIRRDSSDEKKSLKEDDVAYGKRLIYKIGVTTRSIEERVSEIGQFLRKHWCPTPTINVVNVWDGGAGLAELYFKKKYHPQQWPIGTATEYFLLSENDLWELRKDFHQFTLRTEAHKQKIRQALAVGKENRAGRGKEQSDSFLAKPVNQQIAKLLNESVSLREIARRTGAAINTVRKVNALLTK